MNSVIILGAGTSIQEGIDKNLWEILKNQIVFSLNDMFQLYEGTAIIVNDWTFYRDRFKKLKNKPLVIARYDAKYKTEDCPLEQNTLLVPSSPKYYGCDSLKYGCYTGVLAGIYTISLAIGLGFKQIYLLGMDCCELNKKTHIYQNNHNIGILRDEAKIFRTGIGKNSLNRYNTGVFNKCDSDLNDLWKPFLDTKNIQIYNVSSISRINVFQKLTYDEFFKRLQPMTMTQESVRCKIKQKINENT